jgi:hypothetical protein
MIVAIDRPWDSVGCVMVVTLDSFYVGAINFTGTTTITRTATDQFTLSLPDGHCSKSGANPWDIDWTTSKTIRWTSGTQNSQQSQVVEVYGTNTGVDRNGQAFTVDVPASTPVVRSLDCPWITSGVVTLTPDGKSARTIDFGNGNCDNRGTITIEGNTFEFTMQ